MYKFSFTRIRVDLGEDAFTDAEINPELQARWAGYQSLEKLCVEMRAFINARKGQVVENNEGTVNFDTLETTVYGAIEREDNMVLDSKEIKLIHKLLK